MANEDRRIVLVDAPVRALYSNFSDESLRTFEIAFLADRDREAADPLTVKFCNHRLAIIAAILAERRARVQ